MKKYCLLAFVFLAVGAGRVAAQGVTHSFDKDTNFSKYKTYKWVTIPNAQQLDELTAGQLIGTLDVELAKKGLKKSQSDNADLYIGYQIASGKGKPLSNPDIGVAYGAGVGGNAGAATATTTTVHSGQLVLDMYDSATKRLVWRGVVSHAIDPNAKPDKRQKHMDKAVEKLLKDYPPPPKP